MVLDDGDEALDAGSWSWGKGLGIPLVHLRVWVYDESNIPNISASMRAAVF